MKIIESPREGMQSLPFTIPLLQKTEYINLLLRAGFDTVEVGSTASPKFVPQMADTMEMIRHLDLTGSISKMMVLALSRKGAETISRIDCVDFISYPYAISPVFIKKNLNVTMDQSLEDVKSIVELCRITNKKPVIYISMAFGNPYGDAWSLELLLSEVEKLVKAGVTVIPLSNVSILINEKMIAEVFAAVNKEFQGIEFGLHLHTNGKGQDKMVDAAYNEGCRRFDTVMHGIGGCPMTETEMLGNLDTAYMLHYLHTRNINTGIDPEIFKQARLMSGPLFAHEN